MPLQFALHQAPMRLGLAEGVDPHQVPWGTLTVAENLCWSKSGRLEKRRGSTALSMGILGGGTVSSAVRLITRGPELALTDGTSLYSRLASGEWVDRGKVPEVALAWRTLVDSVGGVKHSDCALMSNGHLVHAWVTGAGRTPGESGDVWMQVVELETGIVVTAPRKINTTPNEATIRVRVLTSGTTYVIVWTGGSDVFSYVNGTLTYLSSGAAHTGPNGLMRAAIDAYIIGSDFVVAVALDSGGIELTRYSIATVPVEQATTTVAGEASIGIQSISICGAAGETLYIGYADFQTQRIKFAAANPSTLAQTVAPFEVDTSTSLDNGSTVALERLSATSCLFTYSLADPVYNFGALFSSVITNAGVVTTGRTTAHVQLLSRPFPLGSRWYVAASGYIGALDVPNVSGLNDSWLVDVTTPGDAEDVEHRLVGKVDSLVGGSWSLAAGAPVRVSATDVAVLFPFQATPGTTVRQGVRLVRATTGASVSADAWRPLTVGQETYLSSGVLSAYDGVEVFPYGWAHPSYLETDTSNTTPGNVQDGTYYYDIIPERRSAAGVLHRGPAGVMVDAIVAGTDDTVDLVISPNGLSYSSTSPGLLAIYRTEAGGSIPLRLTAEPSWAALLNDSGGTTLTYQDVSTDAALAGRPARYIEGGELDDYQPPANLTSAWHQSRIWLLAGDGRTVWISKDYTTNPGIAPGFNPQVTLSFDKELTTLCPMDEKMIAFAADSFWFVVGVGPTPNGENASWEVASVQTDVGCTNPRSVVSTPDGLLFLSERGLYLLTRGLELVWIGRPIKDQLAAFPDVTSAVVVASRNEIRFTCNNDAGTASVVLVWNYVEKQWTTFRYTVGGVYGAPIADAVMWNGVWTFVTPTGAVVCEASASYLDGSTWVPLTLETAWVNAGGPLAFQSVRRFALEGIANSHHDLTISCGFDTETSYPQSKTFVAGTPVTSTGPLESCSITIGTRRKCQAIRFKIQDATPTNPGTYPVGTGQGPSFDMLGIEVGIKKGLATKSAGHMG